MKTLEVKQSELSGECWSIQFSGLDACRNCSLRDTEDCGGKEIRNTGKNSLGLTVPIGKPVEETKVYQVSNS